MSLNFKPNYKLKEQSFDFLRPKLSEHIKNINSMLSNEYVSFLNIIHYKSMAQELLMTLFLLYGRWIAIDK